MNKNIRIVTFTGRPAAGKSGIIKGVLAARSDFEIFAGKSVTTRPRRAGDVSGEYAHVYPYTFAAYEAEGVFEWVEPHSGYLVGTRTDDLKKALSEKKISIMTLTPNAVVKLHAFAGSDRVLSFFIHAPQRDLIQRMVVNRGDSYPDAIKRVNETETWSPKKPPLNTIPKVIRIENIKVENPPAQTAIAEVLKILEEC